MAKNYIKRGEWYHYMRRVPKQLSTYDQRAHIRIALKTKCEKEAMRLAALYDEHIEKYWRELVCTGEADDDYSKFRKAKTIAITHGFAYKEMSEVLVAPLPELISRVEAIDGDAKAIAAALLGTAKQPVLRLSQCAEKMWPLCGDRWVGRSELQIKKYKTPREAAVNDFISVIGNKCLSTIERADILKFRVELLKRIEKSEITGNTANKKLGHLKDLLMTVAINEEIDVDFKLLFAETRLSEDGESRPPFDASFVQSQFLDGNLLAELNEQARALVLMMIETGARESELIGLTPEDYFLDAEIPHIWIRKNKLRTLKTKSSDRKIPLVGVSLTSAREVALEGIVRYQGNPYSASGTINKYLADNGLKPTTKHSLYSLRHTFKDRLRDAGAPEEVIDELMGHKKSGPKYGRGHLLETKHEWLTKIAFKVPEHLRK